MFTHIRLDVLCGRAGTVFAAAFAAMLPLAAATALFGVH